MYKKNVFEQMRLVSDSSPFEGTLTENYTVKNSNGTVGIDTVQSPLILKFTPIDADSNPNSTDAPINVISVSKLVIDVNLSEFSVFILDTNLSTSEKAVYRGQIESSSDSYNEILEFTTTKFDIPLLIKLTFTGVSKTLTSSGNQFGNSVGICRLTPICK